MSGIELGPFVLDAPIGAGGNGEVWRGWHAAQGVPVAVKVLTGANARDAKWQAAFRKEVQAVAGLDHPGIVLVFDHGVVGTEAARASRGKLSSDAPFLAMELVAGGSLHNVRRAPIEASRLRTLLLSLLDALAHAHARGVLHRDVKPANVLLPAAGEARAGLKLVDFGIAHALDDEADAVAGSGTPAYMAPELFRRAWRDYGPWTDLYALGCLAWELATGVPPFAGDDPVKLARAHTLQDPPPLRPRRPVPIGFEDWLLRLLDKDPRNRFDRCADAAWALASLPDAVDDGDGEEDDLVDVGPSLTLTLDATLVAMSSDTTDRTPTDEDVTSSLPFGGRGETAPFPPTWRRDDPPPIPAPMVGAGLGLWGLRSLPLVDREAERDALWQALAEARRARRARAIVLEGASGTGKSRLAQWIGERADETGAATVWRAVHSPMGGPGEGLARMVARQLGCVGLAGDALERRVDGLLRAMGSADPGERAALASLVDPANTHVRFERPEERWALVGRLIQRTAQRRPAIVWLDDAQWSTDALGFARWLLDQPELAALVVVTIQEEALADRPAEARALADLQAHRQAGTVDVSPLAPSDHALLVRTMLALDPGLAAQVAERTGGNALFAIHLVGDMVQRGALVAGPDGFGLRPGESGRLPGDVREVWTARLDRALAGLGAPARHGLELAACLGLEVDADEWTAVCRRGGALASDALVQRLVQSRLARLTETGWAFVHGMLREAVLASAARRAPGWHAACADELAGRSGSGLPERRGRHLHAAAAWADAEPLLLEGARERFGGFDTGAAEALLDLRGDALDRLGAMDDDVRRATGDLLRSEIASRRDRLDDAAALAARVAERAERFGWIDLHARAIGRLADVAVARGDLPQAEQRYEEARQLHAYRGDRVAEGFALRELGHVAILAGDLARAEAWVNEAHARFEAENERHGLAMCLNALGDIARLRRDWPTSERCFREAMAIHAELGRRSGVSLCKHGLAELARLQGRLEEAERGYREVIALDLQMGREPQIPQLNLALCQIARGAYTEARYRLDRVRRVWEAQKKRGYLACLYVDLLPTYAVGREWSAWDRTLALATQLLAETGMVDLDVAWPAALAGDLAMEAGQSERARAAWAIALAQWRALGDDEQAAMIEAKLAGVRSG